MAEHKKQVVRSRLTGLGASSSPLMQRVYVDMVGDLWHYGHANFCQQARAHGTHLIVGINRDEHCISYKRKPILSTLERVRSAQGARISLQARPIASRS